jgi:spore maturation protein CgeB
MRIRSRPRASISEFMKLVIFGLSISSSWGNGHATLWRGLCRALAGRGHRITFYERDVPYYSAHRDLTEIPGGEIVFYSNWEEALPSARRQMAEADVGIVTSYCPDGIAASEELLSSPVRLRVFYDLDTPVTLERWQNGQSVNYIGPRGLRDFDLTLSYAGGAALTTLRTMLGARRVAPLYGSVDPTVHFPVAANERFRCDLSYLGTYAEDRQAMLESLFIEPARRLPPRRFLIGGAQYPEDFPWAENIHFASHLPVSEHAAFYCSSKLTLNVTRRAMVEMGHCPPGRLFEATGCGASVLSDWWEGLDRFFTPGEEILIARTTEDALQALATPVEELSRIGRRARERALDEHSAERRARDLENILCGE